MSADGAWTLVGHAGSRTCGGECSTVEGFARVRTTWSAAVLLGARAPVSAVDADGTRVLAGDGPWRRSGDVWAAASLPACGSSARDVAVSWDGARVLRASAEAVCVHAREGTTWAEEARLEPGAPITGFGAAAAISADAGVVLVAAPDNPFADVHTFVRSGTRWSAGSSLTPTRRARGPPPPASEARSP